MFSKYFNHVSPSYALLLRMMFSWWLRRLRISACRHPPLRYSLYQGQRFVLGPYQTLLLFHGGPRTRSSSLRVARCASSTWAHLCPTSNSALSSPLLNLSPTSYPQHLPRNPTDSLLRASGSQCTSSDSLSTQLYTSPG